MAPTFHEAFDRLKEQGKARFMGVSSHTPELETVMNHAVDSGRFDVIMVAYNFNNWPDLDNIMGKAHEKGVGFVAMKTLKGAYHTVLQEFTPDERNSFAQAAFKWVNTNANVSRPRRHDHEARAARRVPVRLGQAGDARRTWRCSRSTTAWFRASTAGRAAASVSTRVRPDSRSTTCCATRCTTRAYGAERMAMTKYAKVLESTAGRGTEICTALRRAVRAGLSLRHSDQTQARACRRHASLPRLTLPQ